MSAVEAQAAPGVWPMYRAMVGIGVLCGTLIVSVFVVTRPVIERNKAEALERAIFEVLPAARSSVTFALVEGDRFEVASADTAGRPLVHAGYDEGRRLVGLAVEASGMGYQDVIRLLYGYAFEQDAIVGIQVLESKETPGLGTKIETDPGFLANFERLDVSLTADLESIANAIVFVKQGQKTNPWEVDGITGATISSRAVADILSRSTAVWIPRIRQHVDDFREAP